MAFSITRILKGLRVFSTGSTTPSNVDLIPAGSAGTTTTITSSQTADRTITTPDMSGTLITADGAQALTNKVVDADLNTVTNIRNANIAANAAIDVSKIGSGNISNTELNQLKISSQSIDAANPGSGDVAALLFSTSTTRSAQIKYSVFRSTDTTTAYESGNMIITYSAANSVGNKFELTQERQGDASIAFTITDAGQVQYACTAIAGASHVGKITTSTTEFLQ